MSKKFRKKFQRALCSHLYATQNGDSVHLMLCYELPNGNLAMTNAENNYDGIAAHTLQLLSEAEKVQDTAMGSTG